MDPLFPEGSSELLPFESSEVAQAACIAALAASDDDPSGSGVGNPKIPKRQAPGYERKKERAKLARERMSQLFDQLADIISPLVPSHGSRPDRQVRPAKGM